MFTPGPEIPLFLFGVLGRFCKNRYNVGNVRVCRVQQFGRLLLLEVPALVFFFLAVEFGIGLSVCTIFVGKGRIP